MKNSTMKSLLQATAIGLIFLLGSCADAQRTRPINLGPGVNFGNMLEAPNEGDWGLVVEERFFDRAKEAGFKHIRLPVSWTHHAALTSPYTIDETFFQRVDWAIDQAVSRNLRIIINDHHHDELNNDPTGEEARALAIWEQISTRYQNKPLSVVFEVLNEPHGVYNTQPELWDAYLRSAIAKIRETNPKRKIMGGPVFWNNALRIHDFTPPRDPNFLVSFHFYEPFAFTHQGAGWIDPPPPVGETWTGDRYCLRLPWQSWSWDVDIQKTNQGMSIDYTNGWGGFRLHKPDAAITGATELRFKFDGSMLIRVKGSNDQQSGHQDIQTDGSNQTYSVDLAFLGPDGNINDICFQNFSPDDQPAGNISDIELVANGSVIRLLETEQQMVDRIFDEIGDWAFRRPFQIYLGEFGAYEAGDYASRVRYTRAVREAAERNGFIWGYWELAAGFGIFDPQTNTWREELRDALIPYLGK